MGAPCAALLAMMLAEAMETPASTVWASLLIGTMLSADSAGHRKQKYDMFHLWRCERS
jgi:hypothetical protein